MRFLLGMRNTPAPEDVCFVLGPHHWALLEWMSALPAEEAGLVVC